VAAGIRRVEAITNDAVKDFYSENNNAYFEMRELGVQFLAKKLDLDAGGLKDVAFELGSQFDNLFLLFAAEQNGKALLTCYISKELVASKELNAGQVVRELGKHIQGGGGGQPFFATAGGKNPDGIGEALAAAKKFIS